MTNLEHVDMHSSRNQVVLGSSVLLGLMVPLYLKSTPGAIKTGETIKLQNTVTFGIIFPASTIITARILRMREGKISACVSVHRVGGYPSQGADGGVPLPGMGYPPYLDLGWGTPPPICIWTWDGVAPHPRLGQQREYSLRGGRYASWVHAGGLSYFPKVHKSI